MMRCLRDIVHNILMWGTIYDPFPSKLGIEENWSQLDYPSIYILPLQFCLYVESLLSKPKLSLVSYTDCIHNIVNTADSHCWKWSSAYNIA